MDKWWLRLRRHDRASPPRPIQAEILEECSWAASLEEPIGMIGNVGVGMGKTLAFFLIPEVFDAKRPILIVPPDMRELTEEALWEWSRQYRFRKPRIIYYSQLSRPEATGLLRELGPDLIMADEAHHLRHPTAARTKRFLRYMRQNPTCRFVGMSGTLTASTLSDYAHLVNLALRDYSPLPKDERTVALWGSVLNAEGDPSQDAWNSLWPLNPEAAQRRDTGAMRRSFNHRFRYTPGVVCTEIASCPSALVLTALYPDTSDAVKKALTALRDDFELPNGLEIVDALHYNRALAQVSLGFYYIWDWPGEEDVPWVEARRGWASACRQYLKTYSREGCDSPFLVEEHVRHQWANGGKVPLWLGDSLRAWDSQRHKDPPPTKPVWIDPAPVAMAYKWAMQRPRCLLWYQSRAVGDLLAAFGLPRFGQGDGRPHPDRQPRAALSIAIHQVGKNYQTGGRLVGGSEGWADQLILEPPASAKTWEQMLGRTHRAGQKADVVRAGVFQHTWPLRRSFTRALQRAEYVQDMTSQRQRILLARREGFGDA